MLKTEVPPNPLSRGYERRELSTLPLERRGYDAAIRVGGTVRSQIEVLGPADVVAAQRDEVIEAPLFDCLDHLPVLADSHLAQALVGKPCVLMGSAITEQCRAAAESSGVPQPEKSVLWKRYNSI